MKNNVIELLKKQKNVFLTGGAGVGKSTLTNSIIEEFKSEGKNVAALASTGMAATLINGQTLHSFFDLAIASNLEELERYKKREISKKVKKLVSSMSLIVIDEVSMISSDVFDLIRLRLLQAEYSGAILVVGDFLQLPPVVRGSNTLNFAFESSSWSKLEFENIVLEKVYRTDNPDFIALLNDVRFASLTQKSVESLNEFIRPFGDDLSGYTFLFGKNQSAWHHNRAQLEYIENDLHVALAQVVKHDERLKDSDIERFINDSRIESNLELKVGAPVLFTKNAWNYYNGERGVITKIADGLIYVLKTDNQIVKLEQIAHKKTKWEEKKIESKMQAVETIQLSVYQFPIQLAFAITIHKSQGMSINDLIIETNEIFAPSQFYVALSRAIDPHRVILISPRRAWDRLIFVHKKALDFVAN